MPFPRFRASSASQSPCNRREPMVRHARLSVRMISLSGSESLMLPAVVARRLGPRNGTVLDWRRTTGAGQDTTGWKRRSGPTMLRFSNGSKDAEACRFHSSAACARRFAEFPVSTRFAQLMTHHALKPKGHLCAGCASCAFATRRIPINGGGVFMAAENTLRRREAGRAARPQNLFVPFSSMG